MPDERAIKSARRFRTAKQRLDDTKRDEKLLYVTYPGIFWQSRWTGCRFDRRARHPRNIYRAGGAVRLRRDGRDLHADFEVKEHVVIKTGDDGSQPEDPATLGTVSIGGKVPAVVTDAEKRRAKVISPGGYCWNPAATDCVLVVKGNELYLAGMPQDGHKGLQPGEVMLFSKGASVKVTNDGEDPSGGRCVCAGRPLCEWTENGGAVNGKSAARRRLCTEWLRRLYEALRRRRRCWRRRCFELTCRRGSFPFLPELGSRLQELGREKPSEEKPRQKSSANQALARMGLTVDDVS